MSAPQFAYRSAVEADAAEMISTHYASVHAIGEEHYSREILSAWSPIPDEHRRRWLQSLISETSTLSGVAVCGPNLNGVAGFCIALPSQAQLKALYVHPDFSGQGVGSGLLSFIESRCRSLGLASIELNASYNAERFYMRHGYQTIRHASQPLTDAIAMGAVLMVKKLSGLPDPSFQRTAVGGR